MVTSKCMFLYVWLKTVLPHLKIMKARRNKYTSLNQQPYFGILSSSQFLNQSYISTR